MVSVSPAQPPTLKINTKHNAKKRQSPAEFSSFNRQLPSLFFVNENKGLRRLKCLKKRNTKKLIFYDPAASLCDNYVCTAEIYISLKTAIMRGSNMVACVSNRENCKHYSKSPVCYTCVGWR